MHRLPRRHRHRRARPRLARRAEADRPAARRLHRQRRPAEEADAPVPSQGPHRRPRPDHVHPLDQEVMWSAAAMPPLFGATAAAWPPHSRRGARMPKAILYDPTLCIDCKQCEQACANQNKNPYDDTIAKEQRTSDHKFTYVADTHGNDKFMRKLCMNCLDPTCVSVCPVGALVKHKEGPVSYNADACMGC